MLKKFCSNALFSKKWGILIKWNMHNKIPNIFYQTWVSVLHRNWTFLWITLPKELDKQIKKYSSIYKNITLEYISWSFGWLTFILKWSN